MRGCVQAVSVRMCAYVCIYAGTEAEATGSFGLEGQGRAMQLWPQHTMHSEAEVISAKGEAKALDECPHT